MSPAKTAATALCRYAREQDLVAARGYEPNETVAQCLATSRGEAKAAVLAATKAMGMLHPGYPDALDQLDALASDRPIPSATLDAWATGWEAYAAREAAAADARPSCRVCDRPHADHAPLDFDLPGECDGYQPDDAPTADPDPAVAAVSEARGMIPAALACYGSAAEIAAWTAAQRSQPPGVSRDPVVQQVAVDRACGETQGLAPPHVEAGQAALAERGSLGAVLAGDGLRRRLEVVVRGYPNAAIGYDGGPMWRGKPVT